MAAHCSDDIKNDVGNTGDCRRKIIYQNFSGNFTSTVSGHRCCDVCGESCTCSVGYCVKETKLSIEDTSGLSDCLQEPVRFVNSEQREALNDKLEAYMKKLVAENLSGPIVSNSILQEFTRFHIDQVLNNCEKLQTLKDVATFVEVWRREHSRAILHAISEVFADVASTELEAFDSDEDEADIDIIYQEWASLRDDSELCNLLCESNFTNLDVEMEELDQSGNEKRSVTSLIGNLIS